MIVRYRKASVLKRLKATPLRPISYPGADTFAPVYRGLYDFIGIYRHRFIVDFYMLGSYLDLLIVLVLEMCLISLGLLIAARSRKVKN